MTHTADPTVFLVDDDAAVRDSISMLVEAAGYPVASYASAESFLSDSGPEMRGCLISDLNMPGLNGLQLQEEMALRGIRLPIVFLTGHGDIPISVKAMKGGAVDFHTKPVTGPDLLQSIAAALHLGEQWGSEDRQTSDAVNRLSRLTDRESAVMKGMVVGQTNKEIGKQLGISHRTVEIHKAHLMQKAGVSTVLELARIARLAGRSD